MRSLTAAPAVVTDVFTGHDSMHEHAVAERGVYTAPERRDAYRQARIDGLNLSWLFMPFSKADLRVLTWAEIAGDVKKLTGVRRA